MATLRKTTRGRPRQESGLHDNTSPAATIPDLAGAPARPRRTVPLVYASAYAPCAGRSWWWLSYVCPHCKFGHFGRARSEAQVSGPRRTRCCGRLVIVKVARVYRGAALKEAA